MVCKNHPGVTARRKCYFCKSFICPECQLKSHHHLFCSDACVASYASDASQPSQAEALHLLDRGLNEDLREYGEVIVEQVRADFRAQLDQAASKLDSLESTLDHLKKSLQGHRSFLQEWTDEKNGRFSEWEKAGKGFDRRSSRRTQRITRAFKSFGRSWRDDQARVELSLKDLHETLDRMQALERQHRAALETSMAAQSEEQRESLITAKNSMLERMESLHADARTAVDDACGKIVEIQARTEEKTEQAFSKLDRLLRDELQSAKKAQESRLHHFEQHLKDAQDRTMTKILDDLATLLAAQRGNWDDVLLAATKGSSDAAKTLRQFLAKDLAEQLQEIAKLESEGLKKVSHQARELLIHRIESQLSPWPRRASIVAVILSFFTLAAWPWLFTRTAERQEAFLARWVESQTARIAELRAEKSPQPAPYPPIEAVERIPTEANLSRGDLGKKEVSFTFDGGSNSKAANEILDLLKSHEIRTTMFLTGEFIESHPDLVRRIVTDGHEVGNHLYRHAHLIDPVTHVHYTQEQLIDEMKQVEKVFFDTTGKSMSKLWRAPYGEVTAKQIEWARQQGYVHVGWTKSQGRNLDTQDWVSDPKDKLFRTPAQITQKILGFEREDRHGLNGAIVLMHLGSERSPQTMAHLALPNLFKGLQDRGYRFVPISSMLKTELAQNFSPPHAQNTP